MNRTEKHPNTPPPTRKPSENDKTDRETTRDRSSGAATGAIYLLQEAAKVSIPELNPDGEDQAAHSMRLAIVEALTLLGAPIPEQRRSVAER